ncbi:MAG: hypothetical protein KTR31_13265 [Myxococcales bacterium]|nr:hypothetical protein [Myxococcales bacterium]
MKILVIAAAALPLLVLAGWWRRRTDPAMTPPPPPPGAIGPPEPVHAGAFLRAMNLPEERRPPLGSVDVSVQVKPTVAVQVAGGQPAFQELVDLLLQHAAHGGRRAPKRVMVSWTPVDEGGLLLVEDDSPAVADPPTEHLAFVSMLVKRSRGRIEVNADQRGTQVAVWLPSAIP